jgi:hypothetical protein
MAEPTAGAGEMVPVKGEPPCKDPWHISQPVGELWENCPSCWKNWTTARWTPRLGSVAYEMGLAEAQEVG